MQYKKEIRWGIIGCGNVTEIKSGPSFQTANNSKLIAVMRRDSNLAKDYAERHQVPKWYDNADELIGDNEVDAVYIATPPAFHKYYTFKVAQSKKPVYVEKPMGLNYTECKEMISICDKYKIPLFVAYYRRALDKFIKIKEIIDKKMIGEIRLVSVLFCRPPQKQDYCEKKWWRLNPDISGGGYFIDSASHMIDLLCYFFEEISYVSGEFSNQANLYTPEDIVSCNFLFKNGIHGVGCWCYTSGTHMDYTVIVGSNGKISYETKSNSPIKLEIKGKQEKLYFIEPKYIQKPLIQTIVDELLGEGRCPSNGKSGALTNWFIDNILKKCK